MRLVNRFIIDKQSALLYTKIEIKNILKRADKNYDYYTFAVMELGSNILKYAKAGEIWLLEDEGEYILCALDKGKGIENLDWAIQKGNTSSNNSLGLGLYQLAHNDYYDFLIYTSTSRDIHGSVFLLKPKNLKKKEVCFKRNFMDLSVGGDFVFKKGKYVILGDVTGHGLKAQKSADFIKKYFSHHLFSCFTLDDVVRDLHIKLKEANLRGAVLSVVEINKDKIFVCGVGNVGIMYKNKHIKFLTQKEGIVGEVYSRVSKYEILNGKNMIFLLFSDGIDEKVLYNILNECDDIYLISICAEFFSERTDDKVIYVYKEQQ